LQSKVIKISNKLEMLKSVGSLFIRLYFV